MATDGSPTVRRRRLAAELRRLRGKRTGGTVAKALGWSPAKISRYELGQGGFPVHEVERLLDYYGVAEPRRTQLLDLAADANARGWWEDYADAITREYMEFIGLEAEATSTSIWEVMGIPGLLQTESYARRVMSLYQKVVPTPPSILERRVEVRMRRQTEVLTRKVPLRITAVLDESVLWRKIGSPILMREQLKHLAQISEFSNVEVRILSRGGEPSIIAGSFQIFGFSPIGAIAGLREVVATENVHDYVYVEGEVDTYMHRLCFQALTDGALSPAKSRELILRTAEQVWG